MKYENNHLLKALANTAAPDELFVVEPTPQTYGAFFNGAERIGAALLELGLQPGDRVAAQLEKSVKALQLYLGTVMAGGVFLPLNPAYTDAEIGYFLGDASPHVFVSDNPRPWSNVTHVLALDDLQSEALFTAAPRGPDDLAAILYTSGTTGRSKGAMLTHRALESNSATLRDYWRFTASDVLIHALPIFHTHGLFVATNVALMAGAGLIFQTGFNADAIIEAMPRATALMGVPTFYTRLLDHAGLSKASADMRLFISGSAPLLAQTHAHWTAQTGHHILERYGMTETNMNTSNPYDGARRPGTVGLPLPGVALRIMEGDHELPAGEIGGIEVRGDNVFAGYWQMPEKTAEELRPDGWFITGDLGVCDADGYLTIVGRSKDLIISGGFNVYPKEVESLLDDMETVLESAVIGLPHPDFGEAVAAVVVPQKGVGVTVEAIQAVVTASLAKYKHPKAVFIVDELPRNSMGKVQKKALRETYSDVF